VIADMVRRRRLDLAERGVAASADPDGNPVADDHLLGLDHGRNAVLPEHEDRVRVVRESLVERLAEHRAQRPQVAVADVEREVPAGSRPVQRADEEPERAARVAVVGPAVGDAPGRGRLDLPERGVPSRADADGDEVAGDEARLVHDGRLAVRPAEVLRVRADGELLRAALADQLPQRGAVAALDVHEERRRVARIRQELAVEDVPDRAALPGGERAGRADRQHGERDEPEVEKMALHVSLLVIEGSSESSLRVVRRRCATCKAGVNDSTGKMLR
jgi:hypothetical protein